MLPTDADLPISQARRVAGDFRILKALFFPQSFLLPAFLFPLYSHLSKYPALGGPDLGEQVQ